MNTNELFAQDFMVELDILSGKTSSKELKAYEKAVNEWNKEAQRQSNMGLVYEEDEPEEPDFKIEYRKQWFNLGAVRILNFVNDWDEERDCECITLDYVRLDTGDLDQINIRITKKEWLELLTKLGVNFIQ